MLPIDQIADGKVLPESANGPLYFLFEDFVVPTDDMYNLYFWVVVKHYKDPNDLSGWARCGFPALHTLAGREHVSAIAGQKRYALL